MTTNQLYPFERNRYYPGKMLTTADFQAEQSYHINRSWFMNSLMYGAGIICGCGVISLDDLSVLVESGVVIDSTGREIIIDSSVVRKLSAIEGFEGLTGEMASLCVRYKEKEVHSVYAVSHRESDQEFEYNRISEGYELFLTDRDETLGGYEFETEFLLQENLFNTGNYEGHLLMPSIVSKGRNMSVVLEIKKRTDAEVKLTYRGMLDVPGFIAPDGKKEIEICADDIMLKKGEVLRARFWAKVAEQEADEAEILLRSGSAVVYEDDRALHAENSFAVRVRLSDDEPFKVVSSEIGRINLEMRQGSGADAVRLADIRLMRTENAYVIEEVTEAGRGNYIMAPAQEMMRNSYMEYFNKETELAASVGTTSGRETAVPEMPRTASEMDNIATGTLEIPLGKNSHVGDIRYSGEITHGLGSGNVYVSVGYEYITEDKALGASARSTVYGNPELFARQTDHLVDAETAVRVLNDKGSFVVAARLLRDVDYLVLTYRWVAIRFPSGNEMGVEDYYGKSISAINPTVVMRPRESYYFGVQFNNMDNCSITYELTASGSGEITADGVYTAPAKDGVYEIRIYCTDMPVVCTYAYAIVKKAGADARPAETAGDASGAMGEGMDGDINMPDLSAISPDLKL